MVKVFYLVLRISNGLAVIPQPYPTEQLCNDAATTYTETAGSYYKAICVPHWSEYKQETPGK